MGITTARPQLFCIRPLSGDLLMITDKLNLTEEAALSRMATPDDCSFKEGAES